MDDFAIATLQFHDSVDSVKAITGWYASGRIDPKHAATLIRAAVIPTIAQALDHMVVALEEKSNAE